MAGKKSGTGKACAQFTARLELRYPSRHDALLADKATKADNEGFVKTKVAGSRIVAVISAGSIPSLVHTLDDYLECMTLSERIISHQSIKRF